MVERVVLHIGLPKTGTTYLQAILWGNRNRLRGDGIHLPGRNHREHLWAALDLRERKNLERRDPRAPGAFGRLCTELAQSDASAGLITHEFFCGASADQAKRAIALLAPARVDLVVTARDAAGMLTAGWQERVKNGSTADLRETARTDRPGSEFGWRTWDLHGVLSRWLEAVPAERVFVLPLPGRGTPPEELWQNFAGVLGAEGRYEIPDRAANQSLGAVQVELLRRVNAHLEAFHTPLDRGEWIRGYLAEKHLVAQHGERFGLEPDLLEDCRRRSRAAVDLIVDRSVQVVGDVAGLLVPEVPPKRRSIDSVSDHEMVEAAARLVAEMLADVRALTQQREGGSGKDSDGSTGNSDPGGEDSILRRARGLFRR